MEDLLSPAKDLTLEHQLDLEWSGRLRKFVQARCNCTWRGQPHPPEDGTHIHVAEYQAHLIESLAS